MPLQHMLKPGNHFARASDPCWWNKAIPKKLNTRLDHSAGMNGWGIQINEVLNKRLVTIWVLLLVIATAPVVITYSLVTKDTSTAAGLGAYLVAILAFLATLHYQNWAMG